MNNYIFSYLDEQIKEKFYAERIDCDESLSDTSSSTIIQYPNTHKNVKNGVIIKYFDSGKIKSKCNYKNGKKHGSCIYYYENGNMKYDYNYENDTLNIICIDYYETGRIKNLSYYEKNNKLIPDVNYDIDGKKIEL